MNKNFINKKIMLVFASVIFTVSAFAQALNVKDLVPAEYYEELMNDKYVLRARKEDRSMKYILLPNTIYKKAIEADVVYKDEKGFPFTYEGLYYLSKKDILKKSNSSAKDITIDDVARVCRSVSNMVGMTYYSNSRKKNMTLYDEVYMFNEEDLDKRLPEPIPDQNMGNCNGQVSYCMQKDASFGRNKYKLSYFQTENEFRMEFYLLDKMGKGFFNAVYPGDLKINLVVNDCGDNLLIYLCTDVNSKYFPGIDDIIVESMTARMEAVLNWFLTQF